jgi:hypothetical protein
MKLLKIVLLIVGISLFTLACGSGGGGGGGDDSDGTNLATITTENAQSFAIGAYQGGKAGTVLGKTDETQFQEQDGRSYTMSISRALENALRQVDMSGGIHISANEQGSFDGDCGGNASYDININENTGEFDGLMTFSNYCSDGVTFSGQTTFSGKVDVTTKNLLYFSFNITELTCSCDNASFTLKGNIAFDFSSHPYKITMNIYLKDNSTGKEYKVENYTITITDGGSYVDLVITGKYFDPDHGYVNISTPSQLRINGDDNWPSQGEFLCTGNNGTKARLVALSNEQYRVQADTNGDGSYDYDSGVLNWSDL